MIILSHRLYRKNQRLQAQAQEMRIFQNHIHENPPAVDSSEYHNSRGAPPPTGCRPSWGKLPLYNTTDEHIWYAESGSPAQGLTGQQFNVGDDALREAKHPYLVGINPGFVVNRRDRGGTLDRQTHRQDPRPPPDDKGPTTANHSWATIRSRAYSLFPNWRRLPRVPPSPSIHPATSPVVEDDGSARQLPAPTSIASPKTAAVLDQSYNRGASSKRLDPYRALVGPGTYMMIPLNSEDDQGRTTAPLVKSPFDGPCAPVPPPIPPKSPLRRLMPMQTIVDVSLSPPPIFATKTKADPSMPHSWL